MNFKNLWMLINRKLPDYPSVIFLHDHFSKHNVNSIADQNAPKILMQCVYDPYYYAVFNIISEEIKNNNSVNIELFIPQSINAAVGNDLKYYILRLFPIHTLYSKGWLSAYKVLSNKIAYRSSSWGYPFKDFSHALKAYKIWKKLHSIDELSHLNIDNIFCGDLIIDTYLRFYPTAKVDINSKFLFYVIWQASRDIQRSSNYFDKNHIALYITSYTTYIQHGIAARVALWHKVKVISIANHQQIGKMLTLSDPYHSKNPLRYKANFEFLVGKEEKLKLAKQLLESRLSGNGDAATAYMSTSAYALTNVDCPNVENAVVIFLHDFFDSPHVYADFIFPDFWTWACYTIEVLFSKNIKVLAKPHPNQISSSKEILAELCNKYPDLQLIASDVTNRQLVDGGMLCGITAYGTVAHELAYIGVPSIACASHPHVSFDFCTTAKSVHEYKLLLENIKDLKFINAKKMQEEVLQFYVMHNLDLEIEMLTARAELIELWKLFLNMTTSSSLILNQLIKLKTSPGFIKSIQEMTAFLTNIKNI